MSDTPRISPAEANAKLSEGFTYVDVRTTQEFEAGHPAGAVNVPLDHKEGPNPDFLRAMNAAFGPDAKIVVGCQAGSRSARAAKVLVDDGFKHVLDQRAGWGGARDPFGRVSEPGWQAAGLPSENGAPAGRSWPDMLAKTK